MSWMVASHWESALASDVLSYDSSEIYTHEQARRSNSIKQRCKLDEAAVLLGEPPSSRSASSTRRRNPLLEQNPTIPQAIRRMPTRLRNRSPAMVQMSRW